MFYMMCLVWKIEIDLYGDISAWYQFSLVLDLLFIIQFHIFWFYKPFIWLIVVWELSATLLANKILQFVEDFVFRRSCNIEESNYFDCSSWIFFYVTKTWHIWTYYIVSSNMIKEWHLFFLLFEWKWWHQLITFWACRFLESYFNTIL